MSVMDATEQTRNLQSFLEGEWRSGTSEAGALVDPSTGAIVAHVSCGGLNLEGALEYARRVGGASLKAMSFRARAGLLGQIADALTARRDEWYEISRINSGNTKTDAAIDVDGAIGTLRYFAKIGSELGDGGLLADGATVRLAKDPTFVGQHISAPVKGVAIHINAYNFPAWGLWGKAAVALLAGVPVLAKPATSTSWLSEAMVRAVVDADVLPAGALSLLCGPVGDLLDHVKFGDVIAFTGSAETGIQIRSAPRVVSEGVRVNVEADSLNSAILGPGSKRGDSIFEAFVREVVREMTSKAGQKCTAIRRVFAPADVLDDVALAITDKLAQISIGDPCDPSVDMGPVVSGSQKTAIEKGVRALVAGGARQVDFQGKSGLPAGGSFVAPALLVAEDAQNTVAHDLEVFGPVATIIPYQSTGDLFQLVRKGGGSLAASVYSADHSFLAQAAETLSESHGRVMLIDPSVETSHTGHGIVMPSLLHGGPGRAGNGAELGGLRGMSFYYQRTAVQGSSTTLAALRERLVDLGA